MHWYFTINTNSCAWCHNFGVCVTESRVFSGNFFVGCLEILCSSAVLCHGLDGFYLSTRSYFRINWQSALCLFTQSPLCAECQQCFQSSTYDKEKVGINGLLRIYWESLLCWSGALPAQWLHCLCSEQVEPFLARGFLLLRDKKGRMNRRWDSLSLLNLVLTAALAECIW